MDTAQALARGATPVSKALLTPPENRRLFLLFRAMRIRRRPELVRPFVLGESRWGGENSSSRQDQVVGTRELPLGGLGAQSLGMDLRARRGGWTIETAVQRSRSVLLFVALTLGHHKSPENTYTLILLHTPLMGT